MNLYCTRTLNFPEYSNLSKILYNEYFVFIFIKLDIWKQWDLFWMNFLCCWIFLTSFSYHSNSVSCDIIRFKSWVWIWIGASFFCNSQFCPSLILVNAAGVVNLDQYSNVTCWPEMMNFRRLDHVSFAEPSGMKLTRRRSAALETCYIIFFVWYSHLL